MASKIEFVQGSEESRLLAFDLRQARKYRAWGMFEVAADYAASAKRLAAEIAYDAAQTRRRLTPMVRR